MAAATAQKEYEGGAYIGDGKIVQYEGAASAGALKQFASQQIETRITEQYNTATDYGTFRMIKPENGNIAKIKCWGRNNDDIHTLENDIHTNHILPTLLDTKRKVIIGQRTMMYYEHLEKDAQGKTVFIKDEVQMPAEIEDFFEASGGHRYFQQAAAQLVKNGNVCPEFITNKSSRIAGRTIEALKINEARFLRKEEMDVRDGKVKSAYYKGDGWITNSFSKDFPIRKLGMWQGSAKATDMRNNFMHWTGDSFFCPDNYYYLPIFRGVLQWAELINVIPRFHDSNLKNRFFPSFHIRFRKGMFLDPKYYKALTDEEKTKYISAEAAAKAKFLADVNAVLAGVNNAGRFIFSEEEAIAGVTKQFPDVEIIPIKQDLNDKALLDLHDTAQKAITAAAQIHPTLANIDTAGKLSSGSEMQNALLTQRIVHAPIARDILMEGHHIKRDVDGWNETYKGTGVNRDRRPKFGFADEEIVVRSEDKSGQKTAA